MTAPSSDRDCELLGQLVEANRPFVPIDDVAGRRIWRRLQAGQTPQRRNALRLRLFLAALFIFFAGGTVGAAVVAFHKAAAPAQPLRAPAERSLQRTIPRGRSHSAAVTAVTSIPSLEEKSETPALARTEAPAADLTPRAAASGAPPGRARSKRALPDAGELSISPLPAVAASEAPRPTEDVAPSEEDESTSLSEILVMLRRGRAPDKALEMIKAHKATWPSGRFAPELDMAHLEALMARNNEADALTLLEAGPTFEGPRRHDLRLLRAQLRAKHASCALALADLEVLLLQQPPLQPRVLEQSLAAKASCQIQLGRSREAKETLRRYIELFPGGPFTHDARRALQALR